MKGETEFINNLSVLADTLRLDIDVRVQDGYMEGKGKSSIYIEEGLVMDVKYTVGKGFRFLNNNAGLLLCLEGWVGCLFAYTDSTNVYVVLLGEDSLLENYNEKSQVDLTKICDIIGGCTRPKQSDKWKPLFKE